MSADNYWTVIPTPDGEWQPRMGFESEEAWPEWSGNYIQYDTFAEAYEAGMDAYENDPYGTEYGYSHHPEAPMMTLTVAAAAPEPRRDDVQWGVKWDDADNVIPHPSRAAAEESIARATSGELGAVVRRVVTPWVLAGVDVEGILASLPAEFWEPGEDRWGGANLEPTPGLTVGGVEVIKPTVRGKGKFEPNPDWGAK